MRPARVPGRTRFKLLGDSSPVFSMPVDQPPPSTDPPQRPGKKKSVIPEPGQSPGSLQRRIPVWNAARQMRRKRSLPESDLSSDTESAGAQHGWLHTDSMAALKIPYCGRVFYLQRLLFLLTEPKFHSLLTLSSNNSRSKADTPNKFHNFGIVRTCSFTWFYPGYFFL